MLPNLWTKFGCNYKSIIGKVFGMGTRSVQVMEVHKLKKIIKIKINFDIPRPH